MSELLWAFGRVSGVVSILLFTASVVLGIITRSGRPLPGLPRFSISLVHRNVALIASTFLVLHVGTLLLDTYAKLTVVDILIPFRGVFKPFWQGLGTVALDLVIAIVVTSLLRRRIGVRVATFVHWFTYAMWPVAMAHAIGNGTNGTSGWFLIIAAGCTLAVIVAVMWRTSVRFLETAMARARSLR
ncbi:ferric reductase-like transmembrane domain-containing protein [Frigoribacterium sp. UYMn621]|uniref:ferric reductase-like transmembrane domain-containing protein n=1 Tax=Frigoribacterium sp. UYMn621 TaxID=3156343 RepID=UPI0033920010